MAVDSQVVSLDNLEFFAINGRIRKLTLHGSSFVRLGAICDISSNILRVKRDKQYIVAGQNRGNLVFLDSTMKTKEIPLGFTPYFLRKYI